MLRGASVTCSLDGVDGDADLYVKFEYPPGVPYNIYDHDCKSATVGTSMESCVAQQWNGASEVAYVAVYAVESASNLSIVCSVTPSARMGDACSSQADCKGRINGQKMTCDVNPHEKHLRICRRCKKANQACKRNTQCCSLQCVNNTCQRRQ